MTEANAQFDREWPTIAKIIREQADLERIPLTTIDAILADAKPYLLQLVEGKAPMFVVLALCCRHFEIVTAPALEAMRQADEAVKH
jgi:hypothetical protein